MNSNNNNNTTHNCHNGYYGGFNLVVEVSVLPVSDEAKT